MRLQGDMSEELAANEILAMRDNSHANIVTYLDRLAYSPANVPLASASLKCQRPLASGRKQSCLCFGSWGPGDGRR